jgi:hypothetical protein
VPTGFHKVNGQAIKRLPLFPQIACPAASTATARARLSRICQTATPDIKSSIRVLPSPNDLAVPFLFPSSHARERQRPVHDKNAAPARRDQLFGRDSSCAISFCYLFFSRPIVPNIFFSALELDRIECYGERCDGLQSLVVVDLEGPARAATPNIVQELGFAAVVEMEFLMRWLAHFKCEDQKLAGVRGRHQS